jgi:hypothetical protein
MATQADAQNALWLFRLAYDRLTGTSLAALRRRIREDGPSRRPRSRVPNREMTSA